MVTLLLGLTPPVTAAGAGAGAGARFAVPGGLAGKFSVAVTAESSLTVTARPTIWSSTTAARSAPG
ncbi:hypothetical protein [Nonomuraea insulae]|uniref:Uncharacterized protein n=1 Tax=Nonomuraea insulae TaxID=1616787 RepID=A0ABW1CG68_9ACTN